MQGGAWVAVAAGVAAPVLRRRLRLAPPVVTALAAGAPVGLAVAVPRSRTRDVAVCTLQMWAYIATYQMPHDDPEALRRRVHVRYPVIADRALGLGQLPSVRLQHALARASGLSRADAVLVWTHWLWFLVPHGSLLYVLARRRERFGRSAVLTYAVFDLGAIVYWALPTAPPWYAAQQGVLESDPALRRLMVEQGEVFWRDRWEPLYGFLGGNPLAAMPSIHFATSVMAALVLADVGEIEGAVGAAYAVTLGFALVYLGEHYVIDLLAGLGLTLGVRALAEPATPWVQRAGDVVASLGERARG